MGEIRFVGTGETRGYPYLVCKKYDSDIESDNTRLFLLSNYFAKLHEFIKL